MNIIRCDDAAGLALRAADLIIQTGGEAIRQRGRFTLVLSGGSTPEKAYALLAQPERAQTVDWQKTYLFFGDERLVPHDDPRSNYHMASCSLLAGVRIAADHVFRMPTDGNGAQAAQQYGAELARFFPGVKVPCFDLILLGLGDDGHTASLFPGADALKVEDRWVTWSKPGRLPPPVDRVTLTYPVLNAARQVVFLAAGAGKAQVLRQVLEGEPDRERLPASGVRPAAGTLTWLVDRAAASLLVDL